TCCIINGNHTSTGRSTQTPEKPRGPTPTTVNELPLSLISLPGTDGEPAKRGFQNPYPSTATGWPPTVRSSPRSSTRPSSAWRPNVEKYSPETSWPEVTSDS